MYSVSFFNDDIGMYPVTVSPLLPLLSLCTYVLNKTQHLLCHLLTLFSLPTPSPCSLSLSQAASMSTTPTTTTPQPTSTTLGSTATPSTTATSTAAHVVTSPTTTTSTTHAPCKDDVLGCDMLDPSFPNGVCNEVYGRTYCHKYCGLCTGECLFLLEFSLKYTDDMYTDIAEL